MLLLASSATISNTPESYVEAVSNVKTVLPSSGSVAVMLF